MKKTLLSLKSQTTKWLASKNYSSWKTLFLVLSVILSLCVTLSSEYDSTIFWFAFIISVAISWSISCWGTASVQIESFRVSLGWGFINYSLFLGIASLFVSKQEWGTEYIIGLFFAFIVSLLLVRFCSYISYLLKLNKTKEDSSFYHISDSKFNRCIFYSLLSIFTLMYVMYTEVEQMQKYETNRRIEQKNIQYQKEIWQPITEWNVETLNGNTIYIVKCKKGRLGVYPSKYPQIRDINKNTKIKFLVGEKKNGLIFPERLDVLN